MHGTLRAVFLSWHDSRRSRSLAAKRGLPFVVFVADRTGPFRHVYGALRTALYLTANRPRSVWFQYSLALAVVLAMYRALRPSRAVELVADLHTKALRRDGGRWLRPMLLPLKRWTLRSCHATIVTNEENRRYASETLGVDPHVLVDPVPEAPRAVAGAVEEAGDRPAVVFVCSYAEDEPLGLIRDVAERLSPDLRCVITGDPSHLPLAQREDLERVAELPGFLASDDYWRLLAGAAAIVVPTTEAACLPCGAYEALAVGRRPVLLEDAEARKVFDALAVFAQPDAPSLDRAVKEASGPCGVAPEEGLARLRERWCVAWRELVELTGGA